MVPPGFAPGGSTLRDGPLAKPSSLLCDVALTPSVVYLDSCSGSYTYRTKAARMDSHHRPPPKKVALYS